jgi:DNA-binding NtrC family response regulator
MVQNSNGNILIVDDQDNWRKVLIHLLGDLYSVTAVSNHLDAEQSIRNKKYDLVILDVRLVDKDIFDVSGLSLLKKIKAESPQVGVIVLTGYPDSVRKETLQQYDADAFFFKAPEKTSFDVSGFKTKIAELVLKCKMK